MQQLENILAAVLATLGQKHEYQKFASYMPADYRPDKRDPSGNLRNDLKILKALYSKKR